MNYITFEEEPTTCGLLLAKDLPLGTVVYTTSGEFALVTVDVYCDDSTRYFVAIGPGMGMGARSTLHGSVVDVAAIRGKRMEKGR